jgi:hypothetical protein
MNVRQTRFSIHVATGVTLFATLGVIGWGIFTPLATSEPDRSTSVPRVAKLNEADPTEPPSYASMKHWNRNLRGPLQDVVVKAPVKVKPPVKKAPPVRKEPIDITLVGTMLEAGNEMGLFADASGKEYLGTVGETLQLKPSGIRIETIDSRTAVVSHGGQRTTLQIPSEKPIKPSRPGKKRRIR